MKCGMSGYIALTLPFVLMGCWSSNPGKEANAKQQDPMEGRARPTEAQMEASPKVAGSVNQFGFNLLGLLAKSKKEGENMLVSPASISFNLQTVLVGTTGATQASLIEALALTGQTPQAIQQGAYGLVYEMLKGEDNALSIANSVWTVGGAKLTPDYLKTIRDAYAAEGRSLPDNSQKSVDEVNDWVKANTRDRIPSILDDIDPMARVILVNAIAFDGKWASPFDAKMTKEDDFTRGDGSKVKAPFMQKGGEFRYASTPAGDIVQLDYREGRFSMMLMLPVEGKSVNEFAASLAGGGWEALTAAMPSRDGTVRLPKWTFRDKYVLNDPLKTLGAGPAFTPSRDWLTMSPDLVPEAFIGRVIHKTYVEVDEEGTKAAAATGTEIRATAAPADQPFKFEANRPFAYAIRHNASGTILFIGICGDPTGKGE